MDAIDPNIPVTPPPSDPLAGTPSETPPSSPPSPFLTSDIEPAPEPNPFQTGLTLIAYAEQIGTAMIASHEQIRADEIQDTLASKGFYIALVLRALDFRQMSKSLKNYQENYEKLVTNYNELIQGPPPANTGGQNANIQQYNNGTAEYTQTSPPHQTYTGVQAENKAINDANQAIQDYNNGTINATQLQAAFDTYNAFAAERNAEIGQYNNDSGAFAAGMADNVRLLSKVNLARHLIGLPPISGPSDFVPALGMQAVPPTVPPPTIPVAALTPRTEVTEYAPLDAPPPATPEQDEQIEQALEILKILKDVSLELLEQKITSMDRYTDFIKFNLRGKRVVDKDAFTQEYHQPGKSGGSETSSVGLGSQLTNLGSVTLERAVSKAIYEAALSQVGKPLPPDVEQKLQENIYQLLINAGISSGVTAANVLGPQNGGQKPGENAVNLSLAVAFAKNILELVSSPGFEGNVATVTEELGAPDVQEAFVGITKTTLLQHAILTVGIALRAPGLLPQLVANASPETAQGLNTPLSSDLLSASLKDPFIQNALTNTMVEQLAAEGGYNESASLGIIGNALPNALVTPTPEDFAQVLQQGLVQQGVDEAVAQNTVQTALVFLQNQTAQPRLTSEELDQPLPPNLDGATLAKYVEQYFLRMGIEEDRVNYVDPIKDAVQNGEVSTIRELRNQVLSNLLGVNLNITVSLSFYVANIAAEISNSLRDLHARLGPEAVRDGIKQDQIDQQIANASILHLGASTPLNPQDLAYETQQRAQSLIAPELGQDKAEDIARQLLFVVFGVPSPQQVTYEEISSQTSLLNELKSNLEKIRNEADDKTLAALADAFRDYQTPNVDLFTFNQNILDPGKAILYSQLSGPQYDRPLPSNYQRDLQTKI